MASSLLYFVNNLAERIQQTKFQKEHDNKKCETCGIKYKDCERFLECTSFKDDLTEHLDISRAITAESLPLHIASSRVRTGNLWFPSASR